MSAAAVKAPRAEIVLTVLDDGRLLLKGYRMGRWNTTYANGQDSVLDEIPKLLAELREETAPHYPQSMGDVQVQLIERLRAESILSSLRAASIAGRLSTATAHPEGANDAC